MAAPIQTLKALFADQPDVLRMLDRRELDLQQFSDSKLVESYQTRQLYPQPVNLYVTGRTGAGKSSLGNRFLAGSPLPSTGYQDCTWVVQFFRMASNLVYFDLPGSGSSDKCENVNRAALHVPQLEDADDGLMPTDSVPTLDFSDFPNSGRLPEATDTVPIPLSEWDGAECRKTFGADVILYVVSPHTQWLRTDKKYLRDLLRSLKASGQSKHVIFALNLFRNPDGTLKPTAANVEDVKKKLTEDWQAVNSGSPTIIEVNAKSGLGLQALAEAMCHVLPPQKIGNMGDALTADLRSVAIAERSRRFRTLLVLLAARLATFKVDAKAGREDLLQTAFAAICDYAIEVFHEEAAIREAQREAVILAAGSAATEARKDRQQAIKITVKDVEEHQTTEEQVVGLIPEYEDEEYSEEVPTFSEQEVRKRKTASTRAAIGLFEGVLQAVAAPVSAVQKLFGAKSTLNDAISNEFSGAYHYTERVLQAGTKTVTRLRQRLTGFREQKATVTRMVPKVVHRDQEVGKEYLAGGSRVVTEVLALGQAIELIPSDSNIASEFEQKAAEVRDAIQTKLVRLISRIEAAAAHSDSAVGEQQLISILTPVIVE